MVGALGLYGCGGSAAAIDAAPDVPMVDGHYQCTPVPASPGGNSCDDPWRSAWPMDVAGATAHLHMGTSTGLMPDGEIACAGAWVGGQLDCAVTWTRTGRACTGDFHVRIAPDGTLDFWLRALDPAQGQDQARCAR